MQLLADVGGRDRVLAAPEASDRISAACDKLALRIVGARLNTRPGLAVTMLAERLEDERGRVEELAFGDISMHHRLWLWPSYRALDPVACSAFRALESSGASLFTDATAEQLLGLQRAAIDRVMEDLVRHNLLTSVTAPVPSPAYWSRTV